MSDTPEPDLRTEVDIPLKFPVTVGGQDYLSLTMRRPRGGDSLWFEKLKGADVERSFKMFARLCNVDPAVISELDDIDIKALDDQYGSFRGVVSERA